MFRVLLVCGTLLLAAAAGLGLAGIAADDAAAQIAAQAGSAEIAPADAGGASGAGAGAGSGEADDGLPFSGALAIPPAVLGALLVAGGLVLRRQTMAAGMAARAG
jgi:hypothetical protein